MKFNNEESPKMQICYMEIGQHSLNNSLDYEQRQPQIKEHKCQQQQQQQIKEQQTCSEQQHQTQTQPKQQRQPKQQQRIKEQQKKNNHHVNVNVDIQV
jgi:hypothetical protein